MCGGRLETLSPGIDVGARKHHARSRLALFWPFWPITTTFKSSFQRRFLIALLLNYNSYSCFLIYSPGPLGFKTWLRRLVCAKISPDKLFCMGILKKRLTTIQTISRFAQLRRSTDWILQCTYMNFSTAAPLGALHAVACLPLHQTPLPTKSPAAGYCHGCPRVWLTVAYR